MERSDQRTHELRTDRAHHRRDVDVAWAAKRAVQPVDAQQRAQSYKEEGDDPWRWGRNTTDADGGKSKEWGAEGRRRGEDVGEASPLADGPATSWRKLWRMPQIGIERRLPRRGILANRVPGSDWATRLSNFERWPFASAPLSAGPPWSAAWSVAAKESTIPSGISSAPKPSVTMVRVEEDHRDRHRVLPRVAVARQQREVLHLRAEEERHRRLGHRQQPRQQHGDVHLPRRRPVEGEEQRPQSLRRRREDLRVVGRQLAFAPLSLIHLNLGYSPEPGIIRAL